MLTLKRLRFVIKMYNDIVIAATTPRIAVICKEVKPNGERRLKNMPELPHKIPAITI